MISKARVLIDIMVRTSYLKANGVRVLFPTRSSTFQKARLVENKTKTKPPKKDKVVKVDAASSSSMKPVAKQARPSQSISMTKKHKSGGLTTKISRATQYEQDDIDTVPVAQEKKGIARSPVKKAY